MDLLELADMVEAGNDMYGVRDELIKLGYKIPFAVVEGSIDAVEKLRAELLPWYILLKCEQSFIYEDYYATFQHKHSNHKQGYGKGKTEPLARLAALLRAVHEERKDDD